MIKSKGHALHERVAHNLKKIRIARKFTQEEVEKRAELSRGYVSLVENGSRGVSLGTLMNLAWALEVDVSELSKEF
jgi:transcriptional regulator with XRE-family HTH domain